MVYPSSWYLNSSLGKPRCYSNFSYVPWRLCVSPITWETDQVDGNIKILCAAKQLREQSYNNINITQTMRQKTPRNTKETVRNYHSPRAHRRLIPPADPGKQQRWIHVLTTSSYLHLSVWESMLLIVQIVHHHMRVRILVAYIIGLVWGIVGWSGTLLACVYDDDLPSTTWNNSLPGINGINKRRTQRVKDEKAKLTWKSGVCPIIIRLTPILANTSSTSLHATSSGFIAQPRYHTGPSAA